VETILEETRKWATEYCDNQRKEHTKLKRRLQKNLTKCNDMLGEGYNDNFTLLQITNLHQRDKRTKDTQYQKEIIEDELNEIYKREIKIFNEDRNIENDLYTDTCNRAFFDDTRGNNKATIIQELRDKGNNLQKEQPSLNKIATAFWGGKGGLFKQETKRGEHEEKLLLEALIKDNKVLPAHLSETLEADKILNPRHIQKAIATLPNNKSPGIDGFPSEYFKLTCLINPKDEKGNPLMNEFCECITDSFEEQLTNGNMLDMMKEGTLSPLFKKGDRADIANYRPVTVLSTMYKILTRAMVMEMGKVITHLVSNLQGGFQKEKYMGELTRLTQDLLDFLEETEEPGILLSCDQTKAYDLVNHEFMFKVLDTMKLPKSFIDLVKLCYHDNTIRVKVNGIKGEPIKPTNGTRQGCPLAPLIYICAFQPFLSLIEQSELKGIRIPNTQGSLNTPYFIKLLAFADDMLAFLNGKQDFITFKKLLNIYEEGSGTNNNWSKTFALAKNIEEEHPIGWNPKHGTFAKSFKSLGITIGAEEEITKFIDKKILEKVKDKFNEWRSKRIPTTAQGKNLVIKNSCLSKAWHVINNQSPLGGINRISVRCRLETS
jgi:hypothetical protein